MSGSRIVPLQRDVALSETTMSALRGLVGGGIMTTGSRQTQSTTAGRHMQRVAVGLYWSNAFGCENVTL